ncbi:MAG: putative lipid II flippase FtsW [Candidatus Buchananbacteria bacterium]|nr:putative lipid II flippase FtsW [Candidatus Buchananbacteria bacterium]
MNKVKLKHFLKDLFRKRGEKKADLQLIVLISFLTVFGLLMIFSAGVSLGWQKFGDSYFFVKHQILFGLLPGLFLFVILSKIDYFKLKSLATPMLFISIILLVLVYIPGIGSGYGTSRSWINFFGFSLQPSEIVKLTFLIYLVAWLSEKGEKRLKDLHQGFLPFVIVLFVVMLLIFFQPDTGSMSIIVLTSLIVFFVAGGSLMHLSWVSALGFSGLWLVIKFSSYRAERLTTFLHPELDPLGNGYHINQALLAVGSGGFWGRGFGHSRQKFAYLPESAGDSIFAIIAEELGFIVSAALIIAFIFLMLRVLKIAQRCNEPFGRLLAIGIVSWFVIQAFINIAAITGLLPLTGVPLPFISYGGTALMTCLAASGILVNISRQVDLE